MRSSLSHGEVFRMDVRVGLHVHAHKQFKTDTYVYTIRITRNVEYCNKTYCNVIRLNFFVCHVSDVCDVMWGNVMLCVHGRRAYACMYIGMYA